ncbi:MAG TPA: peptidoglycan bridge formation glycyltransferase FemA/FemB family protein [Chitinophagaceae bacterium]
MQFDFSYDLDSDRKAGWKALMDGLPLCPIEQDPEWPCIESAPVVYCYFTASDANQIVCAAVITENRKAIFRSAEIRFGPIFTDPEQLIASILAIHSHYKSGGFMSCTVQLAIQTGAVTDYLENILNKKLKIGYRFDRNNWSSLVVHLRDPEEEIFKSFSKGHKSDIKKALKNNIKVSECLSAEEFGIFCNIFSKMNRERGLGINEGENNRFLKNIFEYTTDHNKGKVLLVKNESGDILGGIIIVFQGKCSRYFKGASDLAYRHLPILHLAIWEAIRMSKSAGFEQFDLWGYNHFVQESDQVFFINRFKRGFGGEFIFYPKKMYFIFRPLLSNAFQVVKKLRKIIIKRR